MMVAPGASTPQRSASWMRATPRRSLTLPAGLRISNLASTRAGRPLPIRASSTMGVLPTVAAASGWIIGELLAGRLPVGCRTGALKAGGALRSHVYDGAMMIEGQDTPATTERIKTILRRDLKLGEDARIADDMPLVGGEFDLDSLDLLLLITSIEKEFGIRIVEGAIRREAFASVATRGRVVDSARDG